MRTIVAIASLASLVGAAAPSPERVHSNDNRTPAGTLTNGVLTIRLEARSGEWHPDAESQAGVVVHAFGEVGKAPTAPGPLIRVPEGTEIHAFVTNNLGEPMIMRGFTTRGARSPDSTIIAIGETHEFRFVAGKAGTYYYQGIGGGRGPRNVRDNELAGAFIIDPAGVTTPPSDRIFVLSFWGAGGPVDSTAALPPGRFAINGKSWPSTEHLTYTVGDTVRARIINVSSAVHPMHLHGFYFNVDSRGNGQVDSSRIAAEPLDRVVTERTDVGRTFTLSWVPERAGNWLFHCHDNAHVTRNDPLDGSALLPEHLVHVSNHATDMMGGLVMGIEVKERAPSRAVTLASAPRRLRLVAQVDSGGTLEEPAYGFVLSEGTQHVAPTTPLLPGPTIVLKRGAPVAITVVNHTTEPTAVHWHGIELESYYDGVADFSGSGTHIAHAIAPKDSFVAHFTPPRAGTFMYHPHADELRQQQAGLTGVIVVVDDPANYDPSHDLPIMITVPRKAADGTRVYLNGSLAPKSIAMNAGDTYRLRIVNLHTYRPSMIARFMRDSTVMTWAPLAKDGMDLPLQRRSVRPARVQLGNGEAYDFEVRPTEPGEYRFLVTSGALVPLASLPVVVRAKP